MSPGEFMSESLDQRDYLAGFEQSSNPACILEPIRRDGQLVDLRLLRCNEAFAKLHDARNSFKGDGSLLSVGGDADYTSVLRVSSLILKNGKPRTLRLHLAGPGQWRRCTFARSESGNIVAIFTEIEEGARPGGIEAATPTIGDFFESGGIKLILRPPTVESSNAIARPAHSMAGARMSSGRRASSKYRRALRASYRPGRKLSRPRDS
jgi:hypothetical protein